jgi:hypothetical protein
MTTLVLFGLNETQSGGDQYVVGGFEERHVLTISVYDVRVLDDDAIRAVGIPAIGVGNLNVIQALRYCEHRVSVTRRAFVPLL